MLCENLKRLRQEKGISQETMANHLHVVRQTISKWEKGLSVPDAEMLIQIADYFQVSVGQLLGETTDQPDTADTEWQVAEIAAKLELLNAQFALRSEKNRRHWRMAWSLLCIGSLLALLFVLLPVLKPMVSTFTSSQSGVIGGADGSTSIFLISSTNGIVFPVLVVVLFVAVVGIILTRRKR